MKSMMIIIFSIIGILYVPSKLMILNNDLIPVSGSVTEVKKSSTRIPFYRFRISNRSNLFYNSGTGLLSNLKNDKEVLYNNMNKEVGFFISKMDLPSIEKGKDINYIGLEKKNVLIDLFYYEFSQLGKLPFFFFGMLVTGFNAYGIYTFRKKIFELLAIFYLFYSFLILAL